MRSNLDEMRFKVSSFCHQTQSLSLSDATFPSLSQTITLTLSPSVLPSLTHAPSLYSSAPPLLSSALSLFLFPPLPPSPSPPTPIYHHPLPSLGLSNRSPAFLSAYPFVQRTGCPSVPPCSCHFHFFPSFPAIPVPALPKSFSLPTLSSPHIFFQTAAAVSSPFSYTVLHDFYLEIFTSFMCVQQCSPIRCLPFISTYFSFLFFCNISIVCLCLAENSLAFHIRVANRIILRSSFSSFMLRW